MSLHMLNASLKEGLHDQLWYVPPEERNIYNFQGWSHPDCFGNDNPIEIEYCSGNGSWIAAKAQENPGINYIAVEKKGSRARKILKKAHKRKLKNLIVVYGEGLQVTSKYFPDASIQAVYINFPDPWPKRRHAKNRIVNPDFVEQIHRILDRNGVFTLVTDDPDYSAIMIKELRKFLGFSSLYPEPYYITDLPNYGTSFFEDLWRQKGKNIHYHGFKKN